MAALKTRITPARRRPPRRIPASAAVAMGETITLSLLELGGASVAPPRPPARSVREEQGTPYVPSPAPPRAPQGRAPAPRYGDSGGGAPPPAPAPTRIAGGEAARESCTGDRCAAGGSCRRGRAWCGCCAALR